MAKGQGTPNRWVVPTDSGILLEVWIDLNFLNVHLQSHTLFVLPV